MGDKFRSIKPVPNAFVINIGDMLSRLSNYVLKATLHRVICIGDDRISSPFFFEPYYAAKIPSSLFLGDEGHVLTEEQKYWDNVMYGDYMIEKIIGYCVQYKGITKGKKVKAASDELEAPPLEKQLS